MAKSSSTGDAIEQLIEQRNQFLDWLARLDDASNQAPESVRVKVRQDYQTRLDAVVEELREHTDEVAEQLERHEDTRAGLMTRKERAEEVLAEAELRHSVGEYDESRWQEVKGEADRNLAAIGEELNTVTAEVQRLTAIQELIRSGPSAGSEEAAESPAPVESPPPGDAPDEQAELVMEAETPAAVESEEPVAEAETEPEPEWTPPSTLCEGRGEVDELAFLKSVTEDDGMSSRRRTSGPMARPVEEQARPSTASPRTLKCGECGTMNRPTEWYCERCGAELADL
jgi:hypothetical protein